MFRRLKLSSAAKEDLLEIQAHSHRLFGARQAALYKKLLGQALRDVDCDPERPGSQPRPVLGAGFRSYRVELSRHRSGTGVKGSRHVLVYVLLSDGFIGVSRILHDSMIMERHIPATHVQGEHTFLLDEEE